MKRKISLFLVFVLALMSLTACKNTLEVHENTIYIKKNGKIIGAAIEAFDKDYYSAEELETYVNERVETYLTQQEKETLKVDRFSVESGVASLYMEYDGFEDYAAFNEVELFEGSIPQALLAGYTFSDNFLKVENGKLGGNATKDEVTADNYNVVILSEKVNVKVDGTVLFVSENYTGIKAKDTVSIRLPEDALDGEELKLTYIIYK